ncbi:MAG: LacI family DNA-binding transcriptional regulator [Actinobacteria bacterium]|nr:LacI family DNA-binding transcriptional regulator [Actinomycetota bacterium]
MKKPTMRDVSRVSGLSVYTVSRALSEDPTGVTAESRERVVAAAKELGYVPNRAAQQLRRNTRSSVAVITSSTSNYYYIDLMRGIQGTLRDSGRTVVVADIAAEGYYSPEIEDATIQDLIQSRSAGVISTLALRQENLDLLRDWQIPIVFVDSQPPATARSLPAITMANYEAGMQVGEHLASHGYDSWLFLAYPVLWSTRFERERGIREAAEKFGAELVVLESPNNVDGAFATLSGFLDAPGATPPRALIAGNNPMIHGAYSVLRDRGIAIPDEVAVVGFDDFAWAGLLDPPLTVLDEDSEAIGVKAARTLTRIMDDQRTAEDSGQSPSPHYQPGDQQEVKGELVIRRSCGCQSEVTDD